MDAARVRPLVERYLRERRNGSVEAQLAKITGQLDAVYWDEVEALAAAAARNSPDRLVFDKEARLLIDLGLLDWQFFEGGAKNRAALLRELYAPSAPNQFYFSEWLGQRYRSFVLMSRVSRGGSDPGTARFAALRPLFQNLPGFPAQAVELFLSGRLDGALAGLTRRMAQKEDARTAAQRAQLSAIRAQMISRARERARGDEELALFDSIALVAEGPESEFRPADENERIEFLRAEIKLVRSLVRLGATGSGLAKTHSVLVALAPRLTKAQLAPLLAAVREADGGLPAPPSIVVAPYVGTGFYEWDRDSVFVPIRSTRSPEESVTTALANFRLMLDAQQAGGALKRGYREAMKVADVHEPFVRDYRGWVLGVAKGFRGSISPEAYAFFKERIGPRPEDLYAPKEWIALTPEERVRTIQECRGRANRAEAGFEDRYRLAIAYAREGRRKEAFDEINEAVRLNPIDGRALLSRAWLLAQLAAPDLARAQYQEVLDLCPNTIWSVYASDELTKG